MADTPAKEPKISIKVFVDKVKKRVLFAEADHSFVDILFSFMTLPMATIIKLLKKLDDDHNKFEVLGSLNNLYQSLVDFPECYLATAECKFSLLNPRNASYNYCTNLKLKIDDSEPIMKHLLCAKCLKNRVYLRACDNAKCVECGGAMCSYPNYNPNVWCGGGGGVFVSDAATYIVTDDFSVIPFTMESCLRLLLDSGIADSSHLEERNLDMGREQILCLLKTALAVDSPFTHFVFDNVLNIQSVGHHWQDSIFDRCEKEAATMILLEVYLQKSTENLLFAEAKEDFVDFLFGFLSIPLGTITGTLLNGSSSITCMDNLYKSILDMSVGKYLKSQGIKDMLLKPRFGQEYVSKNQMFSLQGNFYPNPPKDPRLKEAFLRQSGTFFVTDDLVVTPSSLNLAMSTLHKLKVPFDDVERLEISIGLPEALRMLKASLLPRSALTNSVEHLIKRILGMRKICARYANMSNVVRVSV